MSITICKDCECFGELDSYTGYGVCGITRERVFTFSKCHCKISRAMRNYSAQEIAEITDRLLREMKREDETEEADERGSSLQGGAGDMLPTVLDEGAVMPVRANPSDAGLDLMAQERKVLWPGHRTCFDTGVHVAIPEGHVGLITSKSGLMRDYGIITSGTIDSGYTGSLRVILINTGDQTLDVLPGRKIAQLVILPIVRPRIETVDMLPETARGDGGFGSSGEYADG